MRINKITAVLGVSVCLFGGVVLGDSQVTKLIQPETRLAIAPGGGEPHAPVRIAIAPGGGEPHAPVRIAIAPGGGEPHASVRVA